jgi:hypothetical protein
VQGFTGPAGQESFEAGAADLLSAGHVAGGGGYDHAAVDESGEFVDLAGVVAAVGHGDDHDWGGGGFDAVADGVGGAWSVGVQYGADSWVEGGDLGGVGDGGVVGGVVDDQDFGG